MATNLGHRVAVASVVAVVAALQLEGVVGRLEPSDAVEYDLVVRHDGEVGAVDLDKRVVPP